jgi:hypothetical protein
MVSVRIERGVWNVEDYQANQQQKAESEQNDVP